MFGLGKRMEERTAEAIRGEMSAANMHARAVLADAISQIELRLSRDRDERARNEVSTETAIENLRSVVASQQPADVGPALEQVAEMCALVAERLEADRLERRALTEAILVLARPGNVPLDAQPRVIGGTVLSASDTAENGQNGIAASETVPSIAAPDVSRAGDVIDIREDVPPTIDVPVAGAAWDAFEKRRAESYPANETVEVRQHQGTRLTARRPDVDTTTR
jgi:hypothetical protein